MCGAVGSLRDISNIRGSVPDCLNVVASFITYEFII